MAPEHIEKIPTGIQGFDHLAYGGIPKHRTTLVCGTPGSAKTVFACQFLLEGIRQTGEAGVFITFEETATDIRRNMLGFGWDIAQLERDGKWAFVDASRHLDHEYVIGNYDLGALIARIEHSVRSINAQRVAIDSIGIIMSQFNDTGTIRHELYQLIAHLRDIGVTSVVTAERIDESHISQHRVEEFVADNVIFLNNRLEVEHRRRTIEILKFRGTPHAKGEHPFTIINGKGIVVIPVSAFQLLSGGSNVRVTLGNRELDAMCDGGIYEDSIVLVAGAAGTGKTVVASTFIGGLSTSERGLYFAFEESHQQLVRNARSLGLDLAAQEQAGNLRIECIYPESAVMQDHLIKIQDVIDEFKPDRVVIDSLSAIGA